MKLKPQLLITFTVLISIGLVFQNCGGGVRLSKAAPPLNPGQEASVSKITSKLCLGSVDGMGWQIFSFGIVNLNAVASQNLHVVDSDSDGVPDSEDSSPDNPRPGTSGILQSICELTGNCISTCTIGNYVTPFLNSCDRSSFTDISSAPPSFDSDRDGVPDFLEILNGSDHQRSPGGIAAPDIDYDLDGRGLLQEIVEQTDPNWPDTLQTEARYKPKLKRLPNAAECPAPARYYEIDVGDQPWVKPVAFADTMSLSVAASTFNLSHTDEENVILSYVILKGDIVDPQNGPTFRALLNMKRIRSDDTGFTLLQSDFTEVEKWPN